MARNESGIGRTSLALLAGILGFAAIAATPRAARAQEGRVGVTINSKAPVSGQQPVMVSFLSDGKMVWQTEIRLENGRGAVTAVLAPAAYDVRVEGEGLTTEIKRGLQVFAQRDANLEFLVRPGTGVHSVEY